MARIAYSDISGQERSVPFGPDHPVVTIGRATDCTIRSNRKSVSRRHAEFRFNNGQFEVIDLNSSNGTYVIINDERKPVMGREFLAPNDEVWCGDFILHFMQDEEDDIPTHAGAGVDYPPTGRGTGFDPNPLPGEQPGYAAPAEHNPYGAQSSQDPQPYRQDSQSPYQEPQSAFGSEPYGQSNQFGSVPDPYAAAPAAPSYEPPGAEPQVAWGATEPPHSLNALKHEEATHESGEVERLIAEKQSIEDLASRQAFELEELQRHLDSERRNNEELRNEVEALTQTAAAAAKNPAADAEHQRIRSELDAVRDEKRRLQERLHTSLQLSERATDLEDELKNATKRNLQLESELDSALTRIAELESQLTNGAQVAEASERMREDLLAKERDIEALEGEVERLQGDIESAQKDSRDAKKVAADAGKAIEEAEALKREVDRHKRLVEEFERRNRDLQSEVDEVDSRFDAYKNTIADHEAKLDELEAEIASYNSEAKILRKAHNDSQSALEALQAKGSVDDLKSEIEGLKQRLRLEKERSKDGQHLAEENAELKNQAANLEARVEELLEEAKILRSQVADSDDSPPLGSAMDGLAPEVLTELRERVDMLERIVDAIERANLDALSTVDRVRLQSAIRDTEPKKSLGVLKSLLNET